MNDRKTFLFIDGHGLAHRGYEAMKEKNFTAPDGTPTGMIFTFMNMLYKVQNDYRPDCTVIVFDAGGKTFRHDFLPEYKANREKLDDAFKIQLPILQDLLRFHGHNVISQAGIEADDIIASLSKFAESQGHDVMIVSSDKDFFQLLDENIKVIRTNKRGISDAKFYDVKEFHDEYGFLPSSMTDYLAIVGDDSDNIKGVTGVGKIGAAKVLSQFPTLEKIFENINKVDTRNRNKFSAFGLEKALWIRDNLIKFKCELFNADENFLNECLNFQADINNAIKLAERLALKRVLEHLNKILNGEELFIPSQKSPPLAPTSKIVEPVAPECDLITRNLKSELKTTPGKFANNPKVWDFKTAYYMLHPDTTEGNFQKFIDELKNFEETAAKLEGEILSYDRLHDVMTKIDLPLIPVLNQMEDHGVRLAPEKFSVIQNELEEKILNIEAEIIQTTGVRINLKSPRQVSWLLFNTLGFTPEAKTKSKESYSTDAAVLEKLSKLPNGQIPALILEHRELMKMLSGFVMPLQNAAEGDNVIHTTFLPTSTGTGRLSSKDPNLQNIPAYGNWAEKIKSGLIPVTPGNIFVSADYSQIELRVLAHMSGEEKLIEAFKNGRDIHTETASWVFGTAPEFVTPESRRAAKMINFGLLYGMSVFGLAERLGVSRTEAGEIMEKYFNALPGIQDFLEKSVNEALERGYSKTLAGRIRPVNEISGRGQARERALINSPIQGTAADIARRAMIEFAAHCAGKLFLQVHDSLVCECSRQEADEIAEILSTVMKSSGGEIKHLEVQIKIGESLSDV